MGKIKETLKSVRVKLFLTLTLVIILIIAFLIIVNNVVFGQFFIYTKTQDLKDFYEIVNGYYNNLEDKDIQSELE